MSVRTWNAHQVAGCAPHLQDYLAACAAWIDAEIALVLEAEVEDPWLRGVISYHFGWAAAYAPCWSVTASRYARKDRLCARRRSSAISSQSAVDCWKHA